MLLKSSDILATTFDERECEMIFNRNTACINLPLVINPTNLQAKPISELVMIGRLDIQIQYGVTVISQSGLYTPVKRASQHQAPVLTSTLLIGN